MHTHRDMGIPFRNFYTFFIPSEDKVGSIVITKKQAGISVMDAETAK